MSSPKTANLSHIPIDYEGLMRLHALRPIHDDIDLANAAEITDRLAVLDNLTEDQSDYLDVLSTLIETYENTQMADRLSKGGVVKRLRFLLEENGMSGSDLGRLLGSRTLGPAILRGTRKLSKTHIKLLAKRFRVGPGLFLE